MTTARWTSTALLVLALMVLLGSGFSLEAVADDPGPHAMHILLAQFPYREAGYVTERILDVSFNDEALFVRAPIGVDPFPLEQILAIEFDRDITDADEPDQPEPVVRRVLLRNRPNPFSTATHVEYQLAVPAFVDLAIYSINGRRIRTLVHEEQHAGNHRLRWDGRTDSGSRVSAGVYFYRLRTQDVDESNRLILLR